MAAVRTLMIFTIVIVQGGRGGGGGGDNSFLLDIKHLPAFRSI